eukprot:jgi/Psemu1/326909/estExt_fgenesh1_pg.C_4920008
MPSIQHQTRDHRDAAATAAAATPIAIAHHDNNNNNNNHHHNRCVLLFDMDCFYAQCERVRLGLPLDVELCLFQWNSVLAVTYPARKHGIKRGDSWDDVAAKTKNTARSGGATAYSFLLERASIDEFYLDLTEYCYRRRRGNTKNGKKNEPKSSQQQGSDNNKHNDTDENENCQSQGDTDTDTTAVENTVVAGQTKQQQQQQQRGTHTHHNRYASNTDDGEDHHHTEIELALNRACEVSRWIRNDIWNVLGFTMSAGISTNKTMAKLAASYGKPNGQAVLYPRNFPGVLSETKVTKVRNFGGKLGKAALKVLLDYQKQEEGERWNNNNNNNESDSDRLERLKSTATMADLSRVPLPFLVHSQSMSSESAARFVFEASHGIDHEAVTNTSGALVKSITAFKSFSATKNHTEIFDRWLTVLANEVVERVARDTVRNRRYPRSCTLNYTYYTTANGKRPSTTTAGGGNINTSTRSQRQTRSLRLRFPSEREGSLSQKTASLLAQARDKLGPIIRNHPLRGVGLSASNFAETASAATEGEGAAAGSIRCFFSANRDASASAIDGATSTQATTIRDHSTTPSTTTTRNDTETELTPGHGDCFAVTGSGVAPSLHTNNNISNLLPKEGSVSVFTTEAASASTTIANTRRRASSPNAATTTATATATDRDHHRRRPFEFSNPAVTTMEDKDLEFARKLQASFDRENYALSTANRRRKNSERSKKTPRIDAFFMKR